MFPNRKHHLERVPEILEPFDGPNAKVHRHRGIPRSAVPFVPNEGQLREIQENLPDSISSSSTETSRASSLDPRLNRTAVLPAQDVNQEFITTQPGPEVRTTDPLPATAVPASLPPRNRRLVAQNHVESFSHRDSVISVISDGRGASSEPLPTAGSERSLQNLADGEHGSAQQHQSSSSKSSPSNSGSSEASETSSTSYSSDNEPMTFVECLEQDIQRSLRDGEDFDYLGLYAHPMFDVDEEKMRENIKTQKEILGKVREQPWRLRRKVKLYRIAHAYVERYEGRYLKGTANVANVTKFIKSARRVITNTLANLQPWEDRIKTVENRFGSAGASYFIFLRWMIGMNVIIAASVTCAVMVPQILFGPDQGTTYRNTISSNEAVTAKDITTIYRYSGHILYTPVYYGYYSDEPQLKFGYRLPLAYFCTAMAVLIYSFWVILAKMAANVRISTNNTNSDQHPFSAGTFCIWDYMIANRDTADNKTAAITRQFKELLVEEEHKGRQENKWLRLFLRILAWVITAGLLAASTTALLEIMVYKHSLKPEVPKTFWQTNAVAFTIKAQNIILPELFERLEYLEEYHPLTGLRLHLSRITLLQLLVNYVLITNWIAEGEEMFEESEFAKEDMLWIWNASMPRPVDWESQTSRPENHHGGGHGSVSSGHGADSGHGAPAVSHTSPHGTDDHKVEHPPNTADHHETNSHNLEVSAGDHQSHSAHADEHHGEHGGETTDNSAVEWSGDEHEAKAIEAPVGPNFALAEESPVHGQAELAEEENHHQLTIHASIAPEMEHGPVFSLGDELSVDGNEIEHFMPDTQFVNGSDEAHVSPSEMETARTPPADYDYETPGIIPGRSFHPDDLTTPDVRVLVNGTWLWPTRRLPPRPTRTPPTVPPVTHPPMTIDKLKSLCWENRVAMEGLENLVTESIANVAEVFIKEFFRGIFVRFMTRCWFWDLERFPGYAPFTVSENVLSLINGQQMTWIAFFFSPALAAINLVRLVFLMYFRVWATRVCDIPPETMFSTGNGNNFYYFILLLMLFVSTLFIGYTVCILHPSWHCGPFSRFDKMYQVVSDTIGNDWPAGVNKAVSYMSSPALIIPLLILLVIIIFYLFTVGMALTRKTNDLKRTLDIERTEERRKMMAEMEARAKRKHFKAMGDTSTSEVLEVSIEEAKENALNLLDKMKNRGFPPEEHRDPGKGTAGRRGSQHIPAHPHQAPRTLKGVAQKVMLINDVIRHMGGDTVLVHNEQNDGAPSRLTIPVSMMRAKEKFKKVSRQSDKDTANPARASSNNTTVLNGNAEWELINQHRICQFITR